MRLTVYFPEDSPTTHEVVENKLTVGRLGDNDVQIDEGSVSSHHAEIFVTNGSAVLRDLGSTNGTFRNGEQVTGEVTIDEGDEIYFGNVRSVFMEPVLSAPDESPPAEKPVMSEPLTGSGRPADFHYLSPFPREPETRDTLAFASWGIAAVAVIAAAYAAITVLGS